MADTSFLNRAAIEADQLNQLRSLVAELFPGNKFYARKLEAAGVTFDVASLADFSARFPFTTKSELVADQLAHPPYGTNLTYPLDCYTRFHQTSGTSGKPLRWLDTPENWEGMIESWTQILRAAGVHAADRVMLAFSFGPFIGFWLAFESAQRLGCLCLPGGGLSSEARWRLMLDNQATVLCCTPTYALRLGEVAKNSGAGDSCVRAVIVAGEPGGSIPATRRRIEELWPGARVFDHHGMTEVGPVTYECPQQPGVLHVIESAYYAEVVNPASGQPLPPGEQGELILTTLNRTGSPLLRYKTGDLVKSVANIQHPTSNIQHPISAANQPSTLRSQPCPCGRYELALAGGILGRVDDMIIVRGVNIYPSAVEEIVRGFSEIAEYRVQVTNKNSLAELRLEIEPVKEASNLEGLLARVGKAFETTLALRVPVSAVPPGTLPRFEMKAQRWVVG